MSISSTSSMNLGGMQVLSQMTGNIDYASIVTQLYDAEKAPGDALNKNIQQDQLYINDWSNISNLASQVQNDLVTLGDGSTYQSFSTTTTGAIASASTQSGATPGTYNVTLTKAGSTASMTSSATDGSSGISGAIGKAVSTSTLLSANAFSSPISAGALSFTYGGKTYSYTVNTSDTLGQTLTNLTNLTSGAVTFSYNASTNQINVANSGSGSVVLGSSGDTSNFFQAVGLNGSSVAAGSSANSHLVGVAQLQQSLDSANLAGTLTATPSGGTSTLVINGVNINYNTASDSLDSLMQSINSSTAGVTASYDPVSDKVTLTSKSAQPITVSDGQNSSIASVLGLNGTSSAGTNWVYTLGTHSGLSSPSPTIQGVIPGVNFTFASTATTSNTGTLVVGQNSDTLTKAVNKFIGDFNNLFHQIEQYTGKNGDLSSNAQLNNFGMQLMQDVLSVVPSAQSAGYAQTTAMGIGITTGDIGSTPGTTNSLQVNASTLVKQFQTNPSEVQTILQGIAKTLNSDLTSYTGDFNNLSPLSSIASFGQGVIQDQTNMYNSDIKSLEAQQTNIYNEASAYQQNLVSQFTALQKYQQEMSMEQQAMQAMGG